MPTRVSTDAVYQRVLRGFQLNFARIVRAQEQLATGRSLLRPSDDPLAAARLFDLRGTLAATERWRAAVGESLAPVDTAAAHLDDAAGLVADARVLLLSSMNGTLTEQDRASIASELEIVRDQLLDLANASLGDRYLFGGTALDRAPFVETTAGGRARVSYRGDEGEQRVRIGAETTIGVSLPGSRIFARFEGSGVDLAGLTGVASGSTADEGTGWEVLTLRHESTDASGLAGSGIALVGGGSGDTILGDQTLAVDAAAGTVRLGNGPAVPIPAAGDPASTDLVVENELGGELHLDLSAWNGASFTGTVRGDGSISIDGSTFVPLDFAATDLELVHPETGSIVHVDTTGIRRAGEELAQFGGAVNVFDTLQGAIDDLRNADGLEGSEVTDRLSLRLGELDRNQENVLSGLSTAGSKAARLRNADTRLSGLSIQLEGLLSDVRDADISEVALELAEADQVARLAGSAGLRLLQTSLLNFL